VLLRRVNRLLDLRPELAGHWGKALLDTGILIRSIHQGDHEEVLKRCLINDPLVRAQEAAQDAAKRFDRVPDGLPALRPVQRPLQLRRKFNPHAQALIDAPLVAAEMAAGLRDEPSTDQKLALLNLRFVDPLYFDSVLPAALTHYLQCTNQ